jgi:hypothetical protein
MTNPALRRAPQAGPSADIGNSKTPNISERPPSAQARHHDLTTHPIIAAKFWRNRRGEAVFVTLKALEGRPIADVRVHYTDREGKLRPTGKGVAVVMSRLPDLAKAINKAVERAKALGLLPEPLP